MKQPTREDVRKAEVRVRAGQQRVGTLETALVAERIALERAEAELREIVVRADTQRPRSRT